MVVKLLDGVHVLVETEAADAADDRASHDRGQLGQERLEERVAARAGQADRVEQAHAARCDPWRRIARAGLGGDGLGDKAGHAWVGLAEQALGLDGVPRAARVEQRMRQFETPDSDAHATSLAPSTTGPSMQQRFHVPSISTAQP